MTGLAKKSKSDLPAPLGASADEQPVRLQILDSEYRVACPPDEQNALKAAATYLDETMRGIRDTGKVQGVERIAVMAALNICYELLNNQRHSDELEHAINDRTKRLLEQTQMLLSKLKENGV